MKRWIHASTRSELSDEVFDIQDELRDRFEGGFEHNDYEAIQNRLSKVKEALKANVAADPTAGYLKTNRFNCPSIKTDDQRNALEALEIAIIEKFKQFDTMCDIQLHLTSNSAWSGVIDEYPEGYYIQLEATRSSFAAFVQGDHVIRKPRKLSAKIAQYEVNGERGQVYWMSVAR